MINSLVKIAQTLDGAGLAQEADEVDQVLTRLSQNYGQPYAPPSLQFYQTPKPQGWKPNGQYTTDVQGQHSGQYAAQGAQGHMQFYQSGKSAQPTSVRPQAAPVASQPASTAPVPALTNPVQPVVNQELQNPSFMPPPAPKQPALNPFEQKVLQKEKVEKQQYWNWVSAWSEEIAQSVMRGDRNQRDQVLQQVRAGYRPDGIRWVDPSVQQAFINHVIQGANRIQGQYQRQRDQQNKI